MKTKKLNKEIFLIAAFILAVILFIFLLWSLQKTKKIAPQNTILEDVAQKQYFPHLLTGENVAQDKVKDFFAFSVVIDNAYDLPYQAGLNQASIVYEVLVESNITRLLAVFSSDKQSEKIGPVRSARGYFLDLAQEYGGAFVHVGGSPQALAKINTYDFFNLDEMSANGKYFWREAQLSAPHNVFINLENINNFANLKDIAKFGEDFQAWNFVRDAFFGVAAPKLTIDFSSEHYQVDWLYDYETNVYQRWQDGEKKLTDQNATIRATNVIVQIADYSLIDKERRAIDLKRGGKVFIFNKIGVQEGEWKNIHGRTQFFDANNKPLELLAGTTWVEIVDDINQIKF